MENKKNYFTELYSIDVSSKVEKKERLILSLLGLGLG